MKYREQLTDLGRQRKPSSALGTVSHL